MAMVMYYNGNIDSVAMTLVASYTGRVRREKCFSPPKRPGYKAMMQVAASPDRTSYHRCSHDL